jgi:uncharacterized protein YajQ (UPF0234 family)
MPSFDVVSIVEWSEVSNAVNQAAREVSQRFDFKGTDASIELKDKQILLAATTDDRVEAALTVLQEKLIRRKVSLKHLEIGKPTKGPKGTAKLTVEVKEGIETEKAKQLVQILKDSKLKVQSSIHERSVRVSGKKRDDLQAAIAFLRRAEELELELQFENFRD